MIDEKILQTARPILFNTEMVRAILDGRKTETRRIVKGVPNNAYRAEPVDVFEDGTIPLWYFLYGVPLVGGGRAEMFETIKPPYKRGDYLYIRETWCQPAKYIYWYRVDAKSQNILWRPSIHMPKEAARIFLRVKDIKVERLQDITDEEAEKEGCDDYTSTALGFPFVWDNTIKPKDRDKYGWDANPWVFVIEFEKINLSKVK